MDDKATQIELAADIISAYVGNNKVEANELPALIQTVYSSLLGVDQPEAAVEAPIEKATAAQIRKSITPEALISFVDGKPYKTLKRHLTTQGMTIADYKARYGLPNDYPTTAPTYSEQRSQMARLAGLGSMGRRARDAAPAAKASEPEVTPAKIPARRGRKPAAQA